MSRLRRPLLAACLAAGGLLTVHLGSRWLRGHSLFLSRERATERLERALTDLQPLHVTGYRGLSWCRLLTLDGVTYSDSTHPSTCCWSNACQPFDARASGIHASVSARLQDTGVDVAGFTADGALRTADIALSACPVCRDAYEHRSPAQGEPIPVPGELEYIRIRPGWYLRSEN